jgi:hypothetical protein
MIDPGVGNVLREGGARIQELWLETLSEDLIQYLGSYSGLRILHIRPRTHSKALLLWSRRFHASLSSHAGTLQYLDLDMSSLTTPWIFEHRWARLIHGAKSLTELEIWYGSNHSGEAVVKSIVRAVIFQAEITKEIYQYLMLRSISHLPSLTSVYIVPEPHQHIDFPNLGPVERGMFNESLSIQWDGDGEYCLKQCPAGKEMKFVKWDKEAEDQLSLRLEKTGRRRMTVVSFTLEWLSRFWSLFS